MSGFTDTKVRLLWLVEIAATIEFWSNIDLKTMIQVGMGRWPAYKAEYAFTYVSECFIIYTSSIP